MLESFYIAVFAAVIGWVFAEILIKEGEVLGFWGQFIEWALVKQKVVNGRQYRVESYFFKPLGGCHKCVSGQIALWVYLALHWPIYWAALQTKSMSWHVDIFDTTFAFHIFAICLAVLFSLVIDKLMKFLTKIGE